MIPKNKIIFYAYNLYYTIQKFQYNTLFWNGYKGYDKYIIT